jgi:hypothetical protein
MSTNAIKNYLIIALFAVIIFLSTCNSCRKNPITPGNTTTEHFSDTSYYSDTLGVWTDTVTHKKLIPVYVGIDTSRADYGDTSVFRSKYIYLIKDSLLDATITTISEDRPEVDFKYSLKNTTITNTITIKDSTHTKEFITTNKLYFGGEVVVQPLLNSAYLGLSFAEKNGNLFEVSAGYDFERSNPLVKVGYKKLISFKKK